MPEGDGDPHVSLDISGTPLPAGKLSRFDVVTVSLPLPVAFKSFVVAECGNVRPVSEDDPVFTMPPGFTKLP